MLKQSILVITSATLLIACNGGGGSSTPPAPSPSNQVQPLGIHVSSTYSAGESSIGNIIDARPFATATKFTITLTNPYNGVNITSIKNYACGTISVDYRRDIGLGESSMRGYHAAAQSDGGTCDSLSESTPLLPGQSCNLNFYTADMFNFTNTELLSMEFNYEYTDSAHGRVQKYGLYTGNGPKIPVSTGIIYTNGQGYDFNGNQVATLLMTTESGQDYMYLNSGQKLKMSYDANGKAILDFTNNVVPCTNTGCSNGLVPSPLFTINPYTYVIEQGALANGYNGAIWGLNYGSYGKSGWDEQTGLKIPNVNYIYAVQPDGTIFGQNSNAPYRWGCFNNDGSNFRPVTVDAASNLPESQIFDYGTTTLSYSYYESTNWVMISAGNGTGRLIASTNGDCLLTKNGALDGTMTHWFEQNSGSTGGTNYGNSITQQPLQITSHGVFGYYIYQYGQEGTPTWMNNTPYFMFYKYPPR